jgi:iron complex transport system permease protein
VRRSAVGGALLALGVLAAGVVVAFSIGRFPVALDKLWRALWSAATGDASGLEPAVETVVLRVRGPRVLAAIAVGAALSVAGAAFQGLFRNPLVSPDILVRHRGRRSARCWASTSRSACSASSSPRLPAGSPPSGWST